jgi:hypothetical protein
VKTDLATWKMFLDIYREKFPPIVPPTYVEFQELVKRWGGK